MYRVDACDEKCGNTTLWDVDFLPYGQESFHNISMQC